MVSPGEEIYRLDILETIDERIDLYSEHVEANDFVAPIYRLEHYFILEGHRNCFLADGEARLLDQVKYCAVMKERLA